MKVGAVLAAIDGKKRCKKEKEASEECAEASKESVDAGKKLPKC